MAVRYHNGAGIQRSAQDKKQTESEKAISRKISSSRAIPVSLLFSILEWAILESLLVAYGARHKNNKKPIAVVSNADRTEYDIWYRLQNAAAEISASGIDMVT